MTTKRKNTIAIVAVIVIWGYVGLKLNDYFQAEGQDIAYVPPAKNTIDMLFRKDTFDLKLDYPDPFLRSGRSRQTSAYTKPSAPSSTKPKAKTKPDPVTSWPTIAFNGTLKSNQSEEPRGILKVGDKSDWVRVGDYLGGVKVLTLSKNEIQLEFNGESKVFGK